MAKYKIVNKREGDRYVNCRVLNESAGDYIVQFDDKSIKSVPVGSVSSLNRIDEGVLDKVKEFGNKILSGFKKIGRWVKAKIGNEYVETSHPVNCFEIYRDMPGACFHPSDAVRELADELGIDSSDIDNYDVKYDAESKFGIKWLIKKFSDHNGKRSPYRKLDAMNEDLWNDNPTYKRIARGYEEEIKDEKMPPEIVSFYNFNHSRFDGKDIKTLKDYYTQNGFTQSYDIVDYNELYKQMNKTFRYIQRGRLSELGKTSICVWGAPGIGKTDIIKSLYENYKEESPNMSYVYINLAPMNKRDLLLTYFKKKGDEITGIDTYVQNMLHTYKYATSISDIPSEQLKSFNCEKISENKIVDAYNALNNNIANGGRGKIVNGVYIQETKGTGGIMFFDEISRCEGELIDSLMTFVSERNIANQVVGDKWMFVFAGNSLNFMTKIDQNGGKVGAAENFSIDQAVGERFENYTYIPEFDSWKNYMLKTVPDAPKEIYDWLRDNPLLFLEDIKDKRSFLPNDKKPEREKQSDDAYFLRKFQEVYAKNDPNDMFIFKVGNPRNWTAYIKAIHRYMRGEGLEDIFVRDKIMKYMSLVLNDSLNKEDFGYPAKKDPTQKEIEDGVIEKGDNILSMLKDISNASMNSAMTNYKKGNITDKQRETLKFAVETDRYRYGDKKPDDYVEIDIPDISYVKGNYVYNPKDDDYILMNNIPTEKIKDWKEIPDDVILRLGIHTVGAHAAANLTLHHESLSQFSTANGMSAWTGKITDANGTTRNLQYDDFTGIKYNSLNNDRVCGILIQCLRDIIEKKYSNGDEIIIYRIPEFENFIKYIAFLGSIVNGGGVAVGNLYDTIRSSILNDNSIKCHWNMGADKNNALKTLILNKIEEWQQQRISKLSTLLNASDDKIEQAKNDYDDVLRSAFDDIYNKTVWFDKK